MKNYKIEIKWAVIFVAASLVWMAIERMAGLHSENIDKHAIYTNLFAIPAIAIYVFALLEKRKNFYNGRMSYKQGYITGLIITVIVAVLSPLTQYITSTFIAPDFFANIISYSVESGEMTQTDAEFYFSLQIYIVMSFFGALIMGLLTSGIVAFFTKSDGPIEENKISEPPAAAV